MLSVNSLKQKAAEISQEIQNELWDVFTVENLFTKLLEDLNSLAKDLPEKIEIFQLLFSISLKQDKTNQILMGFLFRYKEFGLLKNLNPSEFKIKYLNLINVIQGLKEYYGDEQNFAFAIYHLSLMAAHMSEEEKAQMDSSIFPLLLLPHLSYAIFLRLLPFTAHRPNLSKIKFDQWKQSFLSGLQIGDLDQVHDCLCMFLYPDYREMLKSEFVQFPYQDLLLSFDSVNELKSVLLSIAQKDLNRRLSTIENASAPFQDFFEGIKKTQELSLALRKLDILEKVLNSTLRPEAIKIVYAIEKFNLKEAALHLDNSNLEIFLTIATKLVVLHQKHSSLSNFGLAVPLKVQAEAFYFDLHRFIQKHLAGAQNTIHIFSIIAFASNGIFLNEKGLFFGRWDKPDEVFDALCKIYLPKAEWILWKKYLSDIQKKVNEKLFDHLMRKAFLGSQQIYGRWYQLIAKAALEAINEGQTWNDILLLLGRCRAIITLFLNNVQIPKGKHISYASRIQQNSIDKSWPGSPLNFGVKAAQEEDGYSGFCVSIRYHYFNMTLALIDDFEQNNTNLLQDLKYREGAVQSVRQFDYKNRIIVVYPLNKEGDRAYDISCLSQIGIQKITPTHVLINWRHMPTHLYPRITISLIENKGILAHPFGHEQKIINREVERLFEFLRHSNLAQEVFERNLGQFLFFFFQSIIYKRGTSSIGIILLNVLMMVQGRIPPDALPPYRLLDLEAMCRTEEEFTSCFISWLHGQNFGVH